jgi:hypothetical protein
MMRFVAAYLKYAVAEEDWPDTYCLFWTTEHNQLWLLCCKLSNKGLRRDSQGHQ